MTFEYLAGILGFSWGGLAASLFAARNHDVDAAVSFDGGDARGHAVLDAGLRGADPDLGAVTVERAG